MISSSLQTGSLGLARSANVVGEELRAQRPVEALDLPVVVGRGAVSR